MNGARQRRPIIRARARLALFRRLHQERKKKKTDIVLTPIAKNERYARVYLVLDCLEEYEFATAISCKLPLEGATKKLNDMQKYGFWVPRPQDNVFKYVAPNQIRQAHMEITEG